MTTDRGERAVRRLVQEKNGDAWSDKDLRELIFAFADDQEADHEETMAYVEHHDKEAKRRDDQIHALESWRDTWVRDQPKREQAVIKKHADFHDKYVASLVRRKDDPEDIDYVPQRAATVVSQRFTKEQIVTAVLIFVAIVVTSNLIGALVDRFFTAVAK